MIYSFKISCECGTQFCGSFNKPVLQPIFRCPKCNKIYKIDEIDLEKAEDKEKIGEFFKNEKVLEKGKIIEVDKKFFKK